MTKKPLYTTDLKLTADKYMPGPHKPISYIVRSGRIALAKFNSVRDGVCENYANAHLFLKAGEMERVIRAYLEWEDKPPGKVTLSLGELRKNMRSIIDYIDEHCYTDADPLVTVKLENGQSADIRRSVLEKAAK